MIIIFLYSKCLKIAVEYNADIIAGAVQYTVNVYIESIQHTNKSTPDRAVHAYYITRITQVGGARMWVGLGEKEEIDH